MTHSMSRVGWTQCDYARAARRATACLAACAAILILPPESRGAVTIGSSLQLPPTTTVNCSTACGFIQLELPGRQVTAPIDGIIVRFRLYDSEVSGETLGIWGPNLGSLKGSSSGRDRVCTSNICVYPARVPVSMGDYIGVMYTGGAVGLRNGVAGAKAAELVTEDRVVLGDEVLLNADIEADTDGDLYGDETQDACPTDNSLQTRCPTSASR
jgi:hypothetical protein